MAGGNLISTSKHYPMRYPKKTRGSTIQEDGGILHPAEDFQCVFT